MGERWLSRVPRAPLRPAAETPPEPGNSAADSRAVVVPYVPVRCPRCRARRPSVQGVHPNRSGDVIRYHVCRECSLAFRSRELSADPV